MLIFSGKPFITQYKPAYLSLFQFCCECFVSHSPQIVDIKLNIITGNITLYKIGLF